MSFDQHTLYIHKGNYWIKKKKILTATTSEISITTLCSDVSIPTTSSSYFNHIYAILSELSYLANGMANIESAYFVCNMLYAKSLTAQSFN